MVSAKSSVEAEVLYEKIARHLSEQIEGGVIRAGERVPSIRHTSQSFGVSMSTAIQAYMTLENRGLIEARPKSGFFASTRFSLELPEPRQTKPVAGGKWNEPSTLMDSLYQAVGNHAIVPLGAAAPSGDLLPLKKLNRIAASVSRNTGNESVEYDMPPGYAELRRQVAKRSLDYGCRFSPEDLITTCGCMEAIILSIRAVAKAGDTVAIESPSYFGTLQTLRSLGIKVVEIPTHPRSGMSLDALEMVLRKKRLAAVLIVGNFNNPLGSCMPTENKRRLVEMLAKREIPLIEDDLYGDLYFGEKRPVTAKSFDKKGLVLLCNSFSKTLAPGYRVGWIAPGRFYSQIMQLKYSSTVATASLLQIVIAEFLKNGGYDHHLRAIRKVYQGQVQKISEAVAQCFPKGIKMTRPTGGLVVWIELPEKVDSLKLAQEALKEGISIAPGTMFSARGEYRNFVRLGCGHPWSGRTEQAIGVLGHLTKKML